MTLKRLLREATETAHYSYIHIQDRQIHRKQVSGCQRLLDKGKRNDRESVGGENSSSANDHTVL